MSPPLKRSLAVLVLVAASPLCAPGAGVQGQAAVGFGGAFTGGACVPVLVDLSNDGPTQQGGVTVLVQPSGYSQSRPHRATVELP